MPELEDWKEAGKIAKQTLQYGGGLIKRGASLLEVSDAIEKKIDELGAIPAFPAQISCDEIAAHYCAHPEDKTVFEDQVVNLDVGVSVNGAIGDNALCVDLSGGKWSDLVKASREAVDNALKVAQIGTQLRQIGRTIQETIESHGFVPVKNLSGHGLDEYQIHTRPTVPNFDNGDTTELEKGMFLAIEPFASNGHGMIHEKGIATIFSHIAIRPTRNPYAREIIRLIQPMKAMPFTTRWLLGKLSEPQIKLGLNELTRLEAIKDYPPLVETKEGALVSQAEHSIYVDDKIIVLTK